MNRTELIGNLGADPELIQTPSGTAVCNLRVATNESYTDKAGQKVEKVEWHRIVCFGKLGENCHKYLAKGRQVFVAGKLQTRSWEDKDGVKRFTTEIVAREVEFLGGGRKSDTSDEPKTETQDKQGTLSDDVPF